MMSSDQQQLCGWLWKLGAKGLVKTSKWRYFVFDNFTGHLNYYKTEDTTVPPLGYIDILACRSIETIDPELKEFKLNLPERTWVMTSNGMEETIYWMEELLDAKRRLLALGNGEPHRDSSKDEEEHFSDYELDDDIYDEARGLRRSTGNNTPTNLPIGVVPRSEPISISPTKPAAPPKLTPNSLTQSEALGTTPFDTARPDDWLPLPSIQAKMDLQNTVKEAIIDAADEVDNSRSNFFGSSTDKTSLVSKRSQEKQKLEAKEEEINNLNKEIDRLKRNMETSTREKDELIAVLEKERDNTDREIALKDKWALILQKQLRDAQEASREEIQSGISFEELRDRLQKSQMELAHTRAMLDLQNHRLGGAMEMIAYFKSVVEGAYRDGNKELDMLMEQLQAADQACEQSELRNQALEAQLYEKLHVHARAQGQNTT